MSVETTETKVKYHGNGSSGPWAINFPFTEPKSILAIRVDSSGVEHDLAYGTDYTVTKNISSIGGEATVLVQNGETLTLYREEPLTQKKDFRNFGPNDLEEHERALDKLTLISQQLSEAIDRAVKTSIASDIDPDQLVQSIFDAAIQVEEDKNAVDEAMSNLFSRWNPLMTTVDGQTDYTFQYPVNETDKNALVVLNGLIQDPDSDYSFINPTTIRFNPAPPAGQPLRVITSTSASNPDLQSEIDHAKNEAVVEVKAQETISIAAVEAASDNFTTPEQHGAVGDGVTDDTAAIQAAIDSEKFVLLINKYATTGTLTVSTTGKTIIGKGCESSGIIYSGTGSAFAIADDTHHLKMSNFTIHCTSETCVAVDMLGGGTNYLFDDMDIDTVYHGTDLSYGVRFRGLLGWSGIHSFANCRFQNFFKGVSIEDGPFDITALLFTNCNWNACKHALYDNQSTSSGCFRISDSVCDAPDNGYTQFVSVNGFYNSITNVRIETKKVGGWSSFVNGDYKTHSPVHFGPTAQNNSIINPFVIPVSVGKMVLHEGIRYYYVHPQEKVDVYKRIELQGDGGLIDSDSGQIAIGTKNPISGDTYTAYGNSPRFKFNDGTNNADISLASGGGGAGNITISAIGKIKMNPTNPIVSPSGDNTIDLGEPFARWGTVYAGTGTIDTSDGLLKQQIRTLSAAEARVAQKLKGLIRIFKFNDAVEKKGAAARLHTGIIAQEVKDAFLSEGLSAEDYGLFCYDEWESQFNEKGELEIEAGSRMGIRYGELISFIIYAM